MSIQLIIHLPDPDLLRFIQSKRKCTTSSIVQPKPTESNQKMDIDLSSIELLSNPNLNTWPHFDVVESEKLEWMKDIANSLPKLKSGQSYEARFDWKGVLLPYFTPETDADRELFLHEADAQRPGYTLQELFRLARSDLVKKKYFVFVNLNLKLSTLDRMSYSNEAQPSVPYAAY